VDEVKTEQSGFERWQWRFFPIWTAQLFSLMGSNLVGFALVWWLTKTTGSATVLATASLVGMVPQVLLGPIAGTLVDRWNRRLVMIAADSTIALATLGIAILFWLGDVQIWHLYILMFVRSLAGGFHYPAMQASTSLMVPEKHLARIQGMNSMVNGGVSIAAAPLGALLIELLPMQGVLFIDVITAIIAISPLFFIHVPQPKRIAQVTPAEAAAGVPVNGKTTIWQDFKAGFNYMLGWTGLMVISLMAVVINFLLTPGFALMPILITKHFNAGALQLAWINAAFGAGVILGGLILSVWGGFKRRIYTSMLGIVGMAVGVLMVGLAPSNGYWLALVGMFIMATFNPIANGPLFAVMQSAVAPDMQGRVFTLLGSAASLMSPVGLIVAGPLADRLGVQTWFVVGGVVMIILAAFGTINPAVKSFEDGHPTVKRQPNGFSEPQAAQEQSEATAEKTVLAPMN
jgi:MFS transporter, DHA3 family, macrolide efflux protein